MNGTGFVPLVRIAPLKCTIPEMTRAAAFAVPDGKFCQPFLSFSAVNDFGDRANAAPSSEVPHLMAKDWPGSDCTLATPLAVMLSCPISPVHRLIRMRTVLLGRNLAGRIKATVFLPVGMISPSKRTNPPDRRTAPFLKKLPNSFQPAWSRNWENEAAEAANEAPSSEVKHVALAFAPSEITWVTPVGAMFSSPGVALHMSTGMLTNLDGRKPRGRTNATSFMSPLLAEMAPLKYTIPEITATAGLAVPNGEASQPLSSASLVNVTPGEDVAPMAADGSATAPASTAVTPTGSNLQIRCMRVNMTPPPSRCEPWPARLAYFFQARPPRA